MKDIDKDRLELMLSERKRERDERISMRIQTEEPETKWECPFCGRRMKGLDIFPNEACCGEVGHAKKVDYE